MLFFRKTADLLIINNGRPLENLTKNMSTSASRSHAKLVEVDLVLVDGQEVITTTRKMVAHDVSHMSRVRPETSRAADYKVLYYERKCHGPIVRTSL
jgi:hypothetical protein